MSENIPLDLAPGKEVGVEIEDKVRSLAVLLVERMIANGTIPKLRQHHLLPQESIDKMIADNPELNLDKLALQFFPREVKLRQNFNYGETVDYHKDIYDETYQNYIKMTAHSLANRMYQVVLNDGSYLYLTAGIDDICEVAAHGLHCRSAGGDLRSFEVYINELRSPSYLALPESMKDVTILYKGEEIDPRDLPNEIAASEILILGTAGLFHSMEFRLWLQNYEDLFYPDPLPHDYIVIHIDS